MKPEVLVDAGPLIAIYSPRDQYHSICKTALASITGPLLTTWPVITEAAWLLGRRQGGVQILLQSMAGGLIEVADLPPEAIAWIATFLKRYEDLGAQLADASLMFLAERRNMRSIFTLDGRDFEAYRLPSKRRVRLIPASLRIS